MRKSVVQVNVYCILFLGLFAIIEANNPELGSCPSLGIVLGCAVDYDLQCNEQKQCPNGYRCCRYGCKKRCAAVSFYGQHLGSCSNISGMHWKPCTVDKDCKGHERCCNRNCRKVRKEIVPVKYPVKYPVK